MTINTFTKFHLNTKGFTYNQHVYKVPLKYNDKKLTISHRKENTNNNSVKQLVTKFFQ